MDRKVKPVGFRVLVRLKDVCEDLETKSESGLIIEVKSRQKIKLEKRATQEAYVVELGPTAFKAFDQGEPWCKVGDCVLITKYSGDDLDDIEEGKIYRIINDRDIEAVFPDDGV